MFKYPLRKFKIQTKTYNCQHLILFMSFSIQNWSQFDYNSVLNFLILNFSVAACLPAPGSESYSTVFCIRPFWFRSLPTECDDVLHSPWSYRVHLNCLAIFTFHFEEEMKDGENVSVFYIVFLTLEMMTWHIAIKCVWDLGVVTLKWHKWHVPWLSSVKQKILNITHLMSQQRMFCYLHKP